jgi:hypothetical protein
MCLSPSQHSSRDWLSTPVMLMKCFRMENPEAAVWNVSVQNITNVISQRLELVTYHVKWVRCHHAALRVEESFQQGKVTENILNQEIGFEVLIG